MLSYYEDDLTCHLIFIKMYVAFEQVYVLNCS
jgi:hypothetical protein